MQIVFDGPEQYQEFYQFNSDRGYNVGISSGQFAFQYLYKSSTLCPCETTGLQFAMPPLFVSSAEPAPGMSSITKIPFWISGTPGDTTLSQPSTKYIANDLFVVGKTTYTLASFFWTNNGVPAGFNINDFQRRTFEFTKVTPATPPLGITAPKAGCKCGKQMDIVISLDRSGSISYNQWLLEYQFVQNLIGAFTYGPLATNLGIGNWNSAQWKTLDITSGTSDTVVNSAVASMTCCPGASSTSCCCCGTPIGGGLWLGGSMLAKSTRGKAQKVLLLLTDGCQNHLWDDVNQVAIACACASEKACASNATCVGDITYYYNWVEQNLPGTRIIVIGVGSSTTICTDQLLLAAGGDPLNVYNPTDWNQLLTLVTTITATACTADNTLCPGCCGICTCGQCIPTPQCENPDKCNTGVLDTGSGCCTSQPVVCAQQPCMYPYCSPTQGCMYDDIACPPDETCTQYRCNNSYTCEGQKRYNLDGSDPCPNVVIYKCVNNSQCDDKTACTTDVCLNPATANSQCQNTPVVCPKDDACTTYICKPSSGCVPSVRKCDDHNNCTKDTCDTTKGCQFTTVPCPVPKDPCRVTQCDPIDGCTILPRDCTKEGFVAVNCTVPACNATCYNQYICAAPPPHGSETFPTTVVLVSTLTSAALAGIVIAAVLVAAGLGGGAAVAIAQVAAGGGAVVTASNPLYAGAGLGGNNPLNQG
jgi:hypothetical protein